MDETTSIPAGECRALANYLAATKSSKHLPKACADFLGLTIAAAQVPREGEQQQTRGYDEKGAEAVDYLLEVVCYQLN